MISKKNLIFLLILSLAVILSLVTSIKRAIIENNNNNIEVAIDLNAFEKIFLSEGSDDVQSCLNTLAQSSINSVLIKEDTIKSLSDKGSLSVLSGSELLTNFRVSGLLNPIITKYISKKGIKPNLTYIITGNQKLHERVFGELKIKLKDNDSKIVVTSETITADIEASGDSSVYLITVNLSSDELYNLGLGFDPEAIARVQKVNLSVLAGISDSSFLNPTQIDRIFEKLPKIKNFSGVIIEGKTVPGYCVKNSNTVKYFAQKLSELSKLKAKFVLMEFENIAGLEILKPDLYSMAVKGLRLVNSPANKTAVTDYDDVSDDYLKAIRERNVKVVVFEGITSKIAGVSSNLLMQNYNFLETLIKKIQAAGYNIKSAMSYESDMVAVVSIMIIMWGIVALYILLLEHLVNMPRKISYLILIIFMAFIMAVTLRWHGTYVTIVFRQVWGLLLAFILPIIPFLHKIKIDKAILKLDFYQTIYRSVFLFLYSLSIILIFCLFIIGIFSTMEFLNGAENLNGGFLIFIIPIFIIILMNSKNYNFMEIIKNFIMCPLNCYHVVIFMIFAAVLWLYGEGVAQILNADSLADGSASDVSFIFEKLNSFNIGFIEVFIGYPAILLYFYLNLKNIKKFNFLLSAAGVTGTISLVSSFYQIQAPLYLLTIKVVTGVIAGTAVGVLICRAADFFINHYNESSEEK